MATEGYSRTKDPSPGQEKTPWTWADQISTYRFWGILAFYFFSLIGAGLYHIFLTTEFLPDMEHFPIYSGILRIGSILCIYPAWIAARYNAKAMLLAAGIMQSAGIIVATVPALSGGGILLMPGAFLLGLGSGTIGLLVPVILADGRGGAKVFAISFGSMIVFSRIGETCSLIAGGFVYRIIAPEIIIISSVVLGLFFLIPVKAALFKGAPPQRGYSLLPRFRNPALAALACLIPFYSLYWLYRIHGEVASIVPSRNLLSPRASVLICIFVPFLIPMILTSLSDILINRAEECGRPQNRKALKIFLCSLFCVPIGMALVQSMLNRTMRDAPSTLPTTDGATTV